MTPYSAPGCPTARRTTGTDELRLVAALIGTTPAKILSRDRHHPLPMARMLICNLLVNRLTANEIGRLIHRDHSTVHLHQCKHESHLTGWAEYSDAWRRLHTNKFDGTRAGMW